MKFLEEYNFSEQFYKDLRTSYEDSTLDIFRIEEYNVKEVINYFKEIGIKPIEELILYKIEIFTKDIEIVKEAFNKYNIKDIVSLINEDITNIDMV
jgi:hypothetical protein